MTFQVGDPGHVDHHNKVDMIDLALGDVTHIGVNGGIERLLFDIEKRLRDLEAATPTVPGPTIPVPEGKLEVDNYAGGFIRIRDTANILGDGAVHPVYMALATVPGPGGTLITEPPGVPASTNPVWFDVGGTLGYVNNNQGTHVTQSGLRNWVKYGDPATANHYVLYVRKTVAADDASKPLLVIEGSVTVA
jgi:hypothetical protein